MLKDDEWYKNCNRLKRQIGIKNVVIKTVNGQTSLTLYDWGPLAIYLKEFSHN